MTREILHVDMDAFYASVEQRDHPELRGRPVVVGGSAKSRGVVSAASYEARRFGIHSAMPTAQAVRLCPDAVFLPVRMSRYVAVSRQVMDILRSFTPLVEPISVDEAFLDVTGSHELFGAGPDIARRVKDRIHEELQLTASVGVGPCKFIAKLASDLEKPDGLVVVAADEVEEFLHDLPIEKLWGAGPATTGRLRARGIATIGELAAYRVELLEMELGAHGRQLHELANGRDPRPVVPDHEPKSVGREVTFPADVREAAALHRTLLMLAHDVAARLRDMERRADTVSIKVRFGDFSTVTRQRKLSEPTDAGDAIYRVARDLLERLGVRRAVRLLGVSTSGLHGREARQLSLFESPEEVDHDVGHALDELRRKYGSGVIKPAALLDPPGGGSSRQKRVGP